MLFCARKLKHPTMRSPFLNTRNEIPAYENLPSSKKNETYRIV
jgi:hypothetical protein